MTEKRTVALDVYGDFACFTNPAYKLDRTTYDVITPSAARGVLNAIYSKPIEFYYEVIKIEVMNDIQHIDIKKNELKSGKIPDSISRMSPINREEEITQKSNRYLRNVYYRITANIVKQPNWPGSIESLVAQFNRRLSYGKCFYQPYLGTKECVAYFEPVNPDKKPISLTKDFGVSMYDVFDIRKNIPLTKKNQKDVLNFSFYHVKMVDGVINVPTYETILKEAITDA